MAHTLFELVGALRKAWGSNLKSVVLFGDAAAAGIKDRRPQYNTLAVAAKIGPRELLSVTTAVAHWANVGQPAPLLFTADRLRESADVFPVEFANIKECHKVLYGEDPLREVSIDPENLRTEVERELKRKLITLREDFIWTRGRPAGIRELLTRSVSPFMLLFRTALKLRVRRPAASSAAAVKSLARHVDFDPEVFISIDKSLRGGKSPHEDPVAMFKRFLTGVEAVTDAVDKWVRAGKSMPEIVARRTGKGGG